MSTVAFHSGQCCYKELYGQMVTAGIPMLCGFSSAVISVSERRRWRQRDLSHKGKPPSYSNRVAKTHGPTWRLEHAPPPCKAGMTSRHLPQEASQPSFFLIITVFTPRYNGECARREPMIECSSNVRTALNKHLNFGTIFSDLRSRTD